MFRRGWLALVVVALLTAACASASETVAEQLIEGNDGVTDVDIDDDQITVEFEDDEGGGTMTIGGGEVPESLAIPVPDGGEVVTAIDQPGTAMAVIVYPLDQYDDLAGFYEDWVGDQDAQNAQNTTMSNPNATTWYGELSDGVYSIQVVETTDDSGNPAANVTLSWNATG